MKMDPALAGEICRFMETRGFAPMALQDIEAVGFDYLIGQSVQLHPTSAQWMAEMKNEFRTVMDLPSESHEHTVRVGTVGPSEVIAPLKDELEAAYGERILCHRMAVPRKGIEVLEVFDPAVNKWQGILLAAERHGVRPEQIIAIGDDVNDIAMIENAGLGVAMGNARPEVLAIADRVVGSNADDGLAGFLDELVDHGKVAPPPRD